MCNCEAALVNVGLRIRHMLISSRRTSDYTDLSVSPFAASTHTKSYETTVSVFLVRSRTPRYDQANPEARTRDIFCIFAYRVKQRQSVPAELRDRATYRPQKAMRRTRGQKPHYGGFLSGATTGRGTASVVPWMTMLFLVHSNFALATHTVFLETNMKEAWTALLSAGSSSSNSSSSGGGGAREIVDTMLADCQGRKSEGWGAECDRALYLESVLKKIDSSSSAGSTFATGAGAAAEDTQHQQQQVALDSAANEIAVVSEAELPFSAFFHEYAVPRRPVAILSGGGGAGGSGKPADAADGEEQGDLGDQAMDTAQQDGKEENGQQRVQDLILSGIESCLPHSVDPALGTVDGPLRACHDSLLESLPVPRYASEDFVQRFRGQDVLPVGEHTEVERFVSG